MDGLCTTPLWPDGSAEFLHGLFEFCLLGLDPSVLEVAWRFLFVPSAEPIFPARSGVARSAGGAFGSKLAENRSVVAVPASSRFLFWRCEAGGVAKPLLMQPQVALFFFSLVKGLKKEARAGLRKI